MAGESVAFWYVFDIKDVPPGYNYEYSTPKGIPHYKVYAEGTGPSEEDSQQPQSLSAGVRTLP